MIAKALPKGAARTAPVAAVPEPSRPVATDTAFVDEKTYRVRLNGIADYLGTPLSPMHLHVVTGVVAQTIRDKIAAFDPL